MPSNGTMNGSANGSKPTDSFSMFAMAPPPPVELGKQAIDPTVAKKLIRVYTRDYRGPLAGLGRQAVINYNQPLFMRYFIPAMLRDPSLWYGIEMLRGPIISKAKYTVESEHDDVREFVDRQLQTFLTRGLPLSLSSLTYGYCGLETLYEYKQSTEMVEYKGFKYLHPQDTRPVLQRGALIGIMVKRIKRYYPSGMTGLDTITNADLSNESLGIAFLKLPKVYWAVHDQKTHRWYGRSRLEGAFIPWYETWNDKGYREIRHLWFYKNCYDSGCVHYPDGSSINPATGEEEPNVLVATEMLDRRETGAGIAIPERIGEYGGWEYDPPTGVAIPDGLLEYGDSLRDEKWEGIGVPPEVAKAEQTGSFAGRRVPQQAFYSFLQEIANEQVYDWDEQNLRNLVRFNFGPEADYSITPVPILVTLQQEEMGQVTGHLPGDPNDDFYGGDGSGDPNAGPENQLSNGRVEDRGSNAFNQTEKALAKGAKGKKKSKSKSK